MNARAYRIPKCQRKITLCAIMWQEEEEEEMEEEQKQERNRGAGNVAVAGAEQAA